MRAHAQTRALQTYVKRVYYPFLLRDPEIHVLEGVLCALWVHTHPTLAGMPHAQTSLSVAVIVPALSGLPAALAAVEDVIAGSGALGLFCCLSGGFPVMFNVEMFLQPQTLSRLPGLWQTLYLGQANSCGGTPGIPRPIFMNYMALTN